MNMVKIIIYGILNVMIPFYDVIHKIISILTDKPYFSKKLYTKTLMVILFVILVISSYYTIFKLTNLLIASIIMMAMFIIFILYTMYSFATDWSNNKFYLLSNL